MIFPLVLISRQEAKTHGLLWYFTGLACSHGHIAERNTKDRGCRECKKVGRRAYYKAKRLDQEYVKREAEKSREYYANNSEKVKEAQRRYVKENLKVVVQRVQRWRDENRERHRETSNRWQRANPERRRKYNRRYSERHPNRQKAALGALASNQEYQRAARANRRARKKASGGKVTAAERAAVRQRAKGRCANCGKRGKLVFDHIVPLARGGLHIAANLQMLCGPCNQEKYTRDPIEWAQSQGRLL